MFPHLNIAFTISERDEKKCAYVLLTALRLHSMHFGCTMDVCILRGMERLHPMHTAEKEFTQVDEWMSGHLTNGVNLLTSNDINSK